MYLKISVVRNDPTGVAIFLISVSCFCCKVVTLTKDYVAGTSLLRMTLTGRVAWDPGGRTTRVLPLEMVVLVSLVKLVEQTFLFTRGPYCKKL